MEYEEKGEIKMYIDVPASTDLVMDDKIIITTVLAKALKTDTGVLVFTIDTDGYKISLDGIEVVFVAKMQIIIRGSVSVGDATKNNDGVYTVKAVGGTGPTGYITVNEPIVAYADCADTATVDEFDTFILHPTKRSEQLCTLIQVGATPASLGVSFVPGGFWAAPTKPGLPLMQGLLLLTTKDYLVQVETGKYLQDKEEELIPETVPDAGDEVMRKGTLLMRLFPLAGSALSVAVKVGFIQLH